MQRLALAGTLAALLIAAPLTTTYAAQTAPAAKAPTIDINSASVTELETLPGIGRRTAERIVEHRQKNGPFKKIEELMSVQGIGEKSFLRLKPLIAVVPPRTEKAGGRQ